MEAIIPSFCFVSEYQGENRSVAALTVWFSPATAGWVSSEAWVGRASTILLSNHLILNTSMVVLLALALVYLKATTIRGCSTEER